MRYSRALTLPSELSPSSALALEIDSHDHVHSPLRQELSADSEPYLELKLGGSNQHVPSIYDAVPTMLPQQSDSQDQGVEQPSSSTHPPDHLSPILEEIEHPEKGHLAQNSIKQSENLSHHQADLISKVSEGCASTPTNTESAHPGPMAFVRTSQQPQERGRDDASHADDENLAYQQLVEILKTGTSPNKLESAFHYACQHGNVQIVKELLKRGVSVHCRVSQALPDSIGPAAIHLATMHGQSEVASTLLSHDALPNDHYHDQRRPLHDAAETGNETMTAILLQHGARHDLCDSKGIEPLHLASRHGSLKVARLLIDAGASVEAADHKRYRPIHHLAQNCDDPYFTLYLVDLGCDLEARTSQGYTALQLACTAGNNRVLEVLLHHGASPEVGESIAKPLVLAITHGHLRTARLLLTSGVEVNYRSPNTYETIIHVVARDVCSTTERRQYIESETFTLLCQYGADINAHDVRGNTPLHLVVSTTCGGQQVQRQRSTVECLLRNGARADIPNQDGYYPLTLASHNPDLQIFRLVLAASIHKLPDKHLASIDREMRRRKAPAIRSELSKMSSLLSTALVARVLQV